MRMITSDIFDRWTRGAGLVALVVLAWAVVVPDGVFWTAILAAGLMGAALATALLLRSSPAWHRSIATAEAEPGALPSPGGYRGAARLRPIGEQKP